jgi:hypothetical protein
MKIRNQYNREPRVNTRFTQPSLTIPDQGLTIKQILNRYAKGLPLGGVDPNSAIYDDESEGIDPRKLDLVEIQELQSETLDKLNRLKQEAQERSTQHLEIEKNGYTEQPQ